MYIELFGVFGAAILEELALDTASNFGVFISRGDNQNHSELLIMLFESSDDSSMVLFLGI